MSWHAVALKVARERYDHDRRRMEVSVYRGLGGFWAETNDEAVRARARIANLGQCIAVAASYVEIQRRAVWAALNSRRP